jgi:predicted transcriptional regulator of viral defense system
MKFDDLLRIVADEPVFETGLLLAGRVDADDVRRQLSRWVASGKLVMLRRGLYALAPPHRRAAPHPFLVSNRLVAPSYVSLQSALSHHGLIPESVPVTTAVTTGRPGSHSTSLGTFLYRHLSPRLLFGYVTEDVGPGQRAIVASPEKALLDLVHLTPGGDRPAALTGLRLQELERLDRARLLTLAERWPGPKVRRGARAILELADREAEEWEPL